ncbi:hypothetical protein BU24DRAFT_388121 [Aaosphaeria arxii CBS 175.79]|uniref:ER-bound oxygenase mpaB/mpaB'/Rubber oxygenase catalytic domain-containing protein n=1 Tax=Aaosphaeria arxii CBS 175.79 TaxID=1450172 RepID=A0A6A5XW40_9PLEO|nr:uncharacterized protein BU24DRAFT_388121 [Aaosphaeria arxii CBS 175.79]KAF2017143.1 hypothetical protein BU24DRAFT_388121 [Aaosphaeria arxii CBS 175.79]
MAWRSLNPFRRQTENTRYCWGYEFEWTEDHFTPERSEKLKHSYDVLAEECLDRLNAISPPANKGSLPRSNSSQQNQAPDTTVNGEKSKEPLLVPQRDLYALLVEHHESDPKLQELWDEVNTIPEWVDWEQLERGQDVFYRYGGPALTGLTFQSLLGGMGAARVVETLARTGGFSTKVARRRLFETTQHILQCTRSLESLKPGGEGHASSVRVRLLHAAVRQRILKLAKQRPSYYNVEEWGVPVNDLDQMATIGTFCATLIWISFPRQGIYLREQEKTDYVALWRYIGYLLGTPHEDFSTAAKAKAVMESLFYNEVHPSDMSKVLANNIIHALEKQPPTYVSADMLIASARWLNGNELADALDLPRVSFYYWALMAGQCLFFITLCYIYRAIPYLDRRKIARLKKLFYAVIVEAKWGLAGTETMFEFKYVPEYETVTDMGKMSGSKLVGSSIEWRNLRTLGIFLGVVGLSAWTSVRVASAALGRIF